MKTAFATILAAATLFGCGAAGSTPEARTASAAPPRELPALREPVRCEIYNPWISRSCYGGTGFTAPHAEQNGEPR